MTVEEIYGSLENVKVITLAPEKRNAPETIAELTKRGVTVSVGHSMGNLVDGEVAVQHGATLITHLFNAMLPVSPRLKFCFQILKLIFSSITGIQD